MKAFFPLIALASLISAPASARVICTGCEYDEGAAGRFLGAYNALTQDLGTFQHTGLPRPGMFQDFWVFDVSPEAIGSISADFTLLASIVGFFGELYRDAGSVCGPVTCSDINTGQLLVHADALNSRWELFDLLAPGRYVLKIGGIGNPINGGAYSGQLGFLAFAISEAGTIWLMSLGLALMFIGHLVYSRRRRR